MAIVTLTPADIRVGAGSTVSVGTAGETIVPGDFLYLKAADNKHWKAINSSAVEAAVVGVSIGWAAADAPVPYIPINAGTSYLGSATAAWTKGYTYIIGDTSGGLMPSADVTAGQYVTVSGVAASTTSLLLYSDQTGLVG